MGCPFAWMASCCEGTPLSLTPGGNRLGGIMTWGTAADRKGVLLLQGCDVPATCILRGLASKCQMHPCHTGSFTQDGPHILASWQSTCPAPQRVPQPLVPHSTAPTYTHTSVAVGVCMSHLVMGVGRQQEAIQLQQLQIGVGAIAQENLLTSTIPGSRDGGRCVCVWGGLPCNSTSSKLPCPRAAASCSNTS